jgi:hypothetical protein
MVRTRTLAFTFDATGAVEIDADGFCGRGCTQASEVYEQAMGLTGVVRREKPEMRQAVTERRKEVAR